MSPCRFEECTGESIARGMCRYHYNQWYQQRRRDARSADVSNVNVEKSREIDQMTSDDLHSAFLTDVMGYLPPGHPRVAEIFLAENPHRKRYSHSPHTWSDGNRLIFCWLYFNDVVTTVRYRFTAGQWNRFEKLVHASVDVLKLNSGGITDAVLRCALKVHHSTQ